MPDFRFLASAARRWSALAVMVPILIGAAQARADDADWESIREELFGDRIIEDSGSVLALYAPAQAPDAAVVPVTIRLPHATAKDLKSLTLVIDRNPAPVAASLAFGPGYHPDVDVGERLIETRIRLDSFSKVRAIAELQSGKLYMGSIFVAGSGGCSSPSAKDPDEARVGLGKIKLNVFENAARGGDWRDARIMIRHPNFTGMQMDIDTRAYTPAHFVDAVEVRSAKGTIFHLKGGISISENPYIRFTYGATTPEALQVHASDSDGGRFSTPPADANF